MEHRIEGVQDCWSAELWKLRKRRERRKQKESKERRDKGNTWSSVLLECKSLAQ